MNIYCAGPIKGDTRFQDYYRDIISIINSLGHIGFTELNDNFKSKKKLTDKQIFTRDINWIKKSKVMIAEISGPSLGVGFEISFALYKVKIPVLALYNGEATNISAMIRGGNSGLLLVKEYSNDASLKKIISSFLKKYEK